jgi:hypothetical protein
MNDIKSTVLSYIQKNDCVSYTELENLFEQQGYDCRGNLIHCHEEYSHIVYWCGWNAEAFNILMELTAEGLIHKEPANQTTILTSGKVLNMPKVTRNYPYKTDHWLPVVFRPGKAKK